MFRIVSILLISAALLSAQDLNVTNSDELRDELSLYLRQNAAQFWNQRKAAVAAMKSPAEVKARREFIRNWLTQAMGGFPVKTPLRAQVKPGFVRDGYRVDFLTFESRPNFYVTANLYVPTHVKPPFPAVLGTAGHSETGKAISTYQSAWIGMVRRGFLVLAFDPPGQGERNEYIDKTSGKTLVSIGTRQHDMAGTQCLLTGSTFAGYETWDGVRALDYLLTRSDVDPKRIAVAGNSGGGTQSAYLAAVEPRLSAAVISCYMTSWEALWDTPGPQDAEQDFPGFLSSGLDFGDFMIGFSPKPVTMLTGTRDFFPIAGGHATYAEVKKVFRLLDMEQHAGFFEYDDEHGWHQPRREATYRWLTQWVQGKEDDGKEAPAQTEPDASLNVTSTGQVATSLGGETVQSLNWKRASEQFPRRAALRWSSAADAAAGLKEALHLRLPVAAATAREMRSQDADGFHTSSFLLETESGIHVPAVLSVPSCSGPCPAVMVLDSRGKTASADLIRDYLRSGTAVLALDPRGWGESAPSKKSGGYSPEWQLAQRAMLIGRPLPGMQTHDVLAAFGFLQSRKEIDAKRIGIAGVRQGGVIALFAAALQPAMAFVELRETVASYMEIARARTHRDTIEIVVPDVIRHFDLPDVAKAIAPRPLRLVGTTDAMGSPLAADLVRKEYATVTERYQSLGQANRLQIDSH